MNLALDIGNTRIKAGCFEGKQLVSTEVWMGHPWSEMLQCLSQKNITGVVWSAVVPTPEEVIEGLKRHARYVLELTHELPLPFANAYRTPHTLGRDRIAAVAGAHARWPERSCLVVDCGTCIKYDLLTEQGVYLGGNIAPGAAMRLRALHTFTAQLPLVPQEMPPHPIGNSTATAIQNGALRGAALEMAGFIRLFQAQFSDLLVILTGGDATFFQKTLPMEVPVEPHLTLYGLHHLLLFNTPALSSP